jgi:hypothetical protein
VLIVVSCATAALTEVYVVPVIVMVGNLMCEVVAVLMCVDWVAGTGCEMCRYNMVIDA